MKIKMYMLLTLLVLFVLLPGHTAAQSDECRKVTFFQAADNPNLNGYFVLTQKFVPPHTKGDTDFKGHGPMYTVDVEVWYTSSGIYENVYMRAWEVDANGNPQKDYTTAEGATGLWFYRPPEGWELRQIRLTYGYPGDPVISNTLNIDSEGENLLAAWHVRDLRDSNGNESEFWIDPSTWFWNINQYGGISTIEIVGDTNGSDAGKATAITVSIPADPQKTWVLICR